MNARQKLFSDAATSAKHRVVLRPHYMAIVRGGVQVNFWEDGSISRGDVPLDLAARMTLAQARKELRL